jgi:hypothetical protein
MWRSPATPFVVYRPSGTTDHLLGLGPKWAPQKTGVTKPAPTDEFCRSAAEGHRGMATVAGSRRVVQDVLLLLGRSPFAIAGFVTLRGAALS